MPMKLFARCETEPDRLLAITEDGDALTLGSLNRAAEALATAIGGRRLVFLLCENTPGTLLSYLACLCTGAVPLLLDAHIAPPLLEGLLACYHPGFVCAPADLAPECRAVLKRMSPVLSLRDSHLLSTGAPEEPRLHPELALLLTTSGSTGSPKLVRLSHRNLDANALSIAAYLELDENERPVTNLPMSYSYGMSIINSHLLVGAPIILTRRGVLERAFWEQVVREEVTSLAGVPYTYQMYLRAGLMEMELPCLHTLTQAGGKLPEPVHRKFAAWAAETGRRFIVMYGQTEAAPRMGYLPAGRALDKCGSMGIAIPGGKLSLCSENGELIEGADQVGELVYEGDNVALGYAQCPADLALGDQWHGRLQTGDMARRDEDGFFYITGRKKRFVKLYGNRVNLDEVERMLAAQFPDSTFACVGRDDALYAFLAGGASEAGQVAEFLCARMKFPRQTFHIQTIAQIPQNEAGKTIYQALEQQIVY